MLELLIKIVPEIPRLSLLSCLHIILLGTDTQVCHEESTEIILKRFHLDLKNTRLKDLERISFVMGLFNFTSASHIEEQLAADILKELKTRVTEIMKYPRCFTSCLHYLTFKGYADAELISTTLDEEYIKLAYGRNITLGRELFCLDSYVQLNFNPYNGHRLTDKKRKSMGKILCHYIPVRDGEFKLSTTDRILLEIKESSEKLYEHCHMAHILPHFDRPGKQRKRRKRNILLYCIFFTDVVIAYDKRSGNSIDILDHYPENYSGDIVTRDILLKTIEDREHIVLVNIIIGGWNNYVRNLNKLTGLINLKQDQSRKIGFVPVMVSYLCMG